MRNWKRTMLILSLAIEGVLLSNWVYTAKAGPDHHDCQFIACKNVQAPTCADGDNCSSGGTSNQFWKCMPVTQDVYCWDQSQYGSITCTGLCPDNETPCTYTLNFCKY
jgi:hypothetical protein